MRPSRLATAARLAVALLAALAVGSTATSDARAEGGDDEIVIYAFGDSLTAGFGLPVEDGFAPQLEAWLAAQGETNVRVVNAGVSGDTTAQGLARLDWAIQNDADAVIVELGANDALRGYAVDQARDNLDAILTRLSDRGVPVLVAGIIAPLNWGQAYKEAFDGMFGPLAEKHGALYYPNFIAAVMDQPDMILPDGLHPNRRGVAAIVADIGGEVLLLIARVRAERAQAQ